MTSRLAKNVNYTFVPGTSGTAGYPGRPAQPPYTYTVNREVCLFYPGDFAGAVSQLSVNVGDLDANGNYSYNGVYVCTNVPEYVFVPGQPALPPIPGVPPSPSRTVADFQLGWTGRAHSVAVMVGPGKFRFRVPASAVGAVVGLTETPLASGYGDILYGFQVARGITRIIESGAEVLNLGLRANQLLEIRRSQGNIIYLIDGSVVYTRPNSSAPLVLGAALYSGGDEVYDPYFEMFGEGSGESAMLPMRGLAADEVGYAIGVGRMEPLTSTGTGTTFKTGEGAGVMRALRSVGSDRPYAYGTPSLEPLISSGEGFSDLPPYALGAGSMLGLTSSGNMLTGGLGSGAGSMQPMEAVGSDRPYAYGSRKLRPLRSEVYNLTPPDEAFVAARAGFRAELSSFTELFVVVNSSMQFADLIAVNVEYSADAMSSMTLGDQIALDLEIEALVQSLMRVAASSTDPTLYEASVFSMDVGGSTRYTNYGFNSFAQFDGAHYGAKADGIYLLQGRNDDGSSVPASVDFGKTNFGTALRKALPYVYVGAASDGRLLLKVTADKETFVYKLESSSEELKEQRFKLGKGLSATYYKLVLESDGDVFDLASIEFFPVELSRRL